MRKAVIVLLLSMAVSPVLAAAPKFPGYDQIPTAAEMAKSYPDKALDSGKDGGAVLQCTVKKDRSLGSCTVTSETPQGFGFGEAAVQLSQFFRMKAAAKPGARLTIPIQFQNPG